MESVVALLGLLLFFLLVVLPIWLWVSVLGLRRREGELRAQVSELGRRLRALEARPAAPAAPAPSAEAASPAAAPAPRPPPERELETIVAPRAAAPARTVPPPVAPAPPPPAAVPAPAAARPVAPPPPAAAPAAPRGAAPPPPPPRPPFDPLAVLRKYDWEQLIGVKAFSILAGVTVAAAAVYFIIWSVNEGIVTPPVRFAILAVVGVALVVGSELRVAQGYKLTAQSLAAGGIVALYGAFFAGHTLWHFYGPFPTFGLLVLVTAVAVLLSIRRSSLVVAVLGLLGGFATPYLIRTGEVRPLGLFGYLLLLNLAMAWVSYKRRWPALSWLSLAFTALYQAGWVAKYMERPQLPLAIGVFLVFPVVGFAGIWLARRAAAEEPSPIHRWAAAAGALPPALFALYVASSASLSASWPLLLGFLAVLAAGLAAVAAWQGPEWLHPAGALAVLAAVAAFLGTSFTAGDWPRLAAFLAVLSAVYLGTPLLLARLGRDYRGHGRLGVLAAPLLLAAFAAAAHVPTAASPVGFLLPLLALAAAGSAWAVLRAEARVHALSSVMAMLAAAAWSWSHLEPGRLYPALLAYAALGGLFLAAPIVAERRGRPLTGAPAGPLVLGALALLAFLGAPHLARAGVGSLVGLTILAALLEAALFAEAARGRNPLLALAGVVIGFAELVLWAVTGLAAAVLPGLLAAGALAGVALAGALFAAPRLRDPRAAGVFSAAPLLGLAGHAFVLAVAVQRPLALPPAPWLAVLGVLDLAFLAAALLRRRGGLLVGAAAATVLVLLAHGVSLEMSGPVPFIVGGGAIASAALFFTGFLLARRTGAAPATALGPAGLAALVALHGGQLALLLAGADLPIAFLVPAHLLLVAGLLALAWLGGAEVVTLSSAVLSGLAAPSLWRGPTGPEGQLGTAVAATGGDVLWVATPAWLAALAYPLLRGDRGRRDRLSFVAAALASGIYLLVARKALGQLGLGGYMGALPVIQAALLLPHLRLLRRLEPPSPREMGRLALMAASVLALVTVAIPLQLDNQWWTIGWALQGAALAWLWRRLPHPGLLAWAGALLAASFVRLVPFLNPWMLDYRARSAVPIWNWYLYAYLVVAAAHFAGAWLLAGGPDRPFARGPRLSWLASGAGTLLLFFLLNVEIADYWSEGPRITFRFSAGLAPDLSYTIGWALFAVALLVAGVALKTRAARIASIALLVVTVVKAFLHDLAHLSGLYRVASLAGLAVSLALVALVLQRFVLRSGAARPAQATPPAPPPAPSGPEIP